MRPTYAVLIQLAAMLMLALSACSSTPGFVSDAVQSKSPGAKIVSAQKGSLPAGETCQEVWCVVSQDGNGETRWLVKRCTLGNDTLNAAFQGASRADFERFSCSTGGAGGAPEAPSTPAVSAEQSALLTAVRSKGKIVFSSDRGNTNSLPDLYIMNPDGSDLRPLTRLGYTPDCSPDGKQVVARDVAGSIYVVNVDGSGRVTLLSTRTNYSPRWSPAGDKIVYASGAAGKMDIYTMNADGTAQTQLTSTARNALPAWTPDGQIAFFVQADDKYFLMNADGSDVREISKEAHEQYSREWSPDKSAYVVGGHVSREIPLYSADGAVSVQLLQDEYRDADPTWCR